MGYPTPADVVAELQALGYDPTAIVDRIPNWLASSISKLENQTGWVPFLSGVSASYSYQLPEWGTELDLRTGFTAISEVRSGVDPVNNPTGTLLEVDSDYELITFTGIREILPYTRIKFFSNMSSLIEVTGIRGRVSEIDSTDQSKAADVFQAILQDTILLAEQRLQDSSGSVKKVESGSVKYELVVDKTSRIQEWKDFFDLTVLRWTRPVVGFV